jgi:CheY-like chemotaxis protein
MSQLPLSSLTAVRRDEVTFSSSVQHVLLAAGDSVSRESREAQLRAAGFIVSVARTGFEAIVKASCQVPDLIVLDESLVDIDAPETERMITTCPVTSHIPIISVPSGRQLPRKVISLLRRHA